MNTCMKVVGGRGTGLTSARKLSCQPLPVTCPQWRIRKRRRGSSFLPIIVWRRYSIPRTLVRRQPTISIRINAILSFPKLTYAATQMIAKVDISMP